MEDGRHTARVPTRCAASLALPGLIWAGLLTASSHQHTPVPGLNRDTQHAAHSMQPCPIIA